MNLDSSQIKDPLTALTETDRQIKIGKIIVERHQSQLPYINSSYSSGQQEQLENGTNLT